MTVRSTVFYRNRAAGGISGWVYTVPTGFTLIVKELRITNSSANDAQWTLALKAGDTGQTFNLALLSLPASTTQSVSASTVLTAGDQFGVFTPAVDSAVWASGSLLLGVAPTS